MPLKISEPLGCVLALQVTGPSNRSFVYWRHANKTAP
jgi:hypothetical protein